MKKSVAILMSITFVTLSMCGCGNENVVYPEVMEITDSSDAVADSADGDVVTVTEPESTEANAGIGNPWVDTDAKGIMDMAGVEFAVPDGATEVIYRYLESENMSEMQFDLDRLHFCARIKPTAEWEDVSGVYCDWTIEDECWVGEARLEGKCMRYLSDEETTDVCLWYDVVPGLMYSITTTAPDLDGFDIQAIAEAIYKPMQTEAP